MSSPVLIITLRGNSKRWVKKVSHKIMRMLTYAGAKYTGPHALPPKRLGDVPVISADLALLAPGRHEITEGDEWKKERYHSDGTAVAELWERNFLIDVMPPAAIRCLNTLKLPDSVEITFEQITDHDARK